MMATDLDGTVAVIISKPGHTNVCILSITDDRSRYLKYVFSNGVIVADHMERPAVR